MINKDYGTRTDCTRDHRDTILPNATLLGFSTRTARRGSWVVFGQHGEKSFGRIVGRVHCRGETFLEVIATGAGMTWAHVRWIDRTTVLECYDHPPRHIMRFLMGEWKNTDAILRTAAAGIPWDADVPVA